MRPASRDSAADPRGQDLVERCRAFFDAAVRERGDDYLRQDRVELGELTRDGAVAQVEGSATRRYAVQLELDAEGGDLAFLYALCDCLHYADGHLCKHVWATVGALADRGWPADLQPDTDLVTLHAHDESAELWDDELEGEQPLGAVAAPSGADQARQVARRGLRPSARDGGWRALLGTVERRAPRRGDEAQSLPGAAEREAWFVVDPARSDEQGGLVVVFHHRLRKKDGEFGRLKREGVSHETLARYGDAQDRHLLALLVGNEPVSSWSGLAAPGAADARLAGARRIATVMIEQLVPQLCATRRLVWPEADGGAEAGALVPLHWDDGERWALALDCTEIPGEEAWSLEGELRREGERAALDGVRLVTADGLIVLGDRIARLEVPEHAAWIRAFERRASYRLPDEEREAFLVHWWGMPSRPDADLPEVLTLDEVAGVPVGALALVTEDRRGYARRDIYLDLGFVYGERQVEFDAPGDALVELDAGRVVRRDLESEGRLVQRLLDLGARWRRRYHGIPPNLGIAAKHVAALEHALAGEGWQITVNGERLRSPGDISLAVTSDGIDWFDLEGVVDYDGMQVALPTLLDALGAGESTVTLPDGSRGQLPDAWLRQHAALARLGTSDGDRVRFARDQALILDALLAESQGNAAQLDETFRDWRERLRTVEALAPREPPRSFRGTLREYQQLGLGWLLFLDEIGVGGCLADDMGLGKTVQVLALLEWWRTRRKAPERAALPSLVVVPRSLVWNWLDEAARFAPKLRVLDYSGPGRDALRERFAEHDLVVTTYGTVRRDAAALKAHAFHYLILDEAQAIKNARSQAFKACRVLRSARRLALSGTPVENHLGELWALFEFLNPGLLGSAKAFESVSRSASRTDPEAARRIGTGLRPFILRRTKEQVLDDLPPKTEQTLICELGAEQRQQYDELRDYYRTLLDDRIAAVGLGRSKIHVLEALLRLRQAACHPGLVDPLRGAEPSAKLEALLESLEDVVAEGHKALVFSQFTKFLALVRSALDARCVTYEYLDGRTRNRAARVSRFQEDPDCPLFLISLKAGGHGLNLTAADYVFILDPWWNPAVEAQAVDRTHRIGQERPVFAYRLIAKDTVEEKLLALQARKRALAEAVIAEDESVMRQLTAGDLEVLLG